MKTKTESVCQQSSASSKVETTESKEALSAPSTSQDLQQSLSKEIVASTPKQDKLREEIERKELIITTLKKKKDFGIISEDENKSLLKEQQELTKLKKNLHSAQDNQKRQQKFREERKRCISQLDEETKKKIKIKPSAEPGRPCIVEDTDTLLQTICDIAIKGSAADERRRSPVIRSTKTLDDLTEALKSHGYNLSRSSVYLHLRPRNKASREGKRHVKTCPVKLIKAENKEHKYHPDTKFAKATISNLEEVASILGPREVTFHSQDDKCRVALGIPAATKHLS